MFKYLLLLIGIIVVIPLVLLILVLVYPRPEDKTPAWVFEEDASNINYCDLPVLDGSGLMAKEIPQGHTPNCGWKKFPQPILKYCTEPLTPVSQDLRGLWMQVSGGGTGNSNFMRWVDLMW